MKKFLSTMLSLALIYLSICFLPKLLPITFAQAFTKIQGYAQEGGQKVTTQGLTSTTNVQKSYPLSTVTVFDAGTVTVSTIYSNSSGTPKSNPFTSDSTGYWFFYGSPGKRYDVRFSGTGISSPFTLGDFRAPSSSFILANVRDDYNAVGDGKVRQTGIMTAGSTTLTCSDCGFSSSDIGKKIDINGAGPAQTLMGTVLTRSSSTSITVDTRASFTVTNQTIIIGGRTVSDAAMTAGSNIITSNTANFQTYDIGRRITIENAGARNLVTTIAGFTNSTTITLSNSATGTVSNKQVVFGTDDTQAFRNMVASGANMMYVPDPPGDCYILSSRHLTSVTSSPIYAAIEITSSNKSIVGDSPYSSKIYVVSTVMADATTATQGIAIVGCSNIQIRDLALYGTNHDGQPSVGNYAADGLYIDVTGPISDISTTNFHTNNFWVIGWHNPGQQGGTVVKDFVIINCVANYNGADGFNPNPGTEMIMIGNRALYNGTGGIESLSTNATYIGNICKYNSSVGLSIGGLGDPDFDNDFIVSNNIAENNLYGFVFGTNVRSLNAATNIANYNYAYGIDVHDQTGFGTLSRDNKLVNNICISNGGVGGSVSGRGISVSGTTNTILEDNYITNDGTSGFTQIIGILGNGCTTLTVLRNRVSGHSSSDYNFTDCPSTFFVNEIAGVNIFTSGTTTFTYPTITVNGITINTQENLGVTVVADTVLSPFNPANIRVAYITLTGNRTISPFNALADGQLLTLIFVQDGTGNRTLTYAGMLGGTNIGAGQAAGKVNIQTFIFRTGIGWMAYTPAVQNL